MEQPGAAGLRALGADARSIAPAVRSAGARHVDAHGQTTLARAQRSHIRVWLRVSPGCPHATIVEPRDCSCDSPQGQICVHP